MRKILLLSIITLLLSACGDDEIVKEAKILKQKREENKETLENQVAEQEEIYKELSQPVEETIKTTVKDKKSVIKNDYEEKEVYTDETEFAKFVAKQLFQFYNLDLSPKDYYHFLIQYGSTSMKSELQVLENAEEGIVFLTNIQGLISDNQLSGSEYEITEVELNTGKSEGYFYRRVISQGNSTYYITTIIKEGGFWKYQEDSPAPPFEEDEDKAN